MGYNGSGSFSFTTSGTPVVTETVISSVMYNAVLAEAATGLTTAITKDGQTATTARIPFAAGINSTLNTDATSTSTGSIITAGGIGCAKAIFGGTTLNIAGAVTFQTSLNITGSLQCDSVVNDAGLAHGKYTPTFTAVTNVDGTPTASNGDFFYTRVGNTVTVTGAVSVDPTSGSATTEVGISLPAASNLGVSTDANGLSVRQASTAAPSGLILADGNNNRAQLSFVSSGTSAEVHHLFFMYTVI